LLVNIIKHAFDDKAAHTVILSVRTGPGTVTFTTEDDGKPFDPREAPQPPLGRPLEQQGSGYGIYIVRHMTASLDYERVDGNRNRTRAVLEYGTQEAT
jgi:anti-sigma regulatory factor (Ser/Thr protein kinase)